MNDVTETPDTAEWICRRTPERRNVYFVQAVTLGLVKIGVADDAAKRLRHVALASPDRLRVLGFTICWRRGRSEAEFHAMFAAERRHGEWFYPSERLLDFIHAKTIRMNTVFLARLQAVCDEPNKPRGRPPGWSAGTRAERIV